ncbi:hypothetical protein QCA50_016680 [Cerrena zonata]|uniref:C2H2-type domain-containing protein n=1 Tax=Cerrena zonata TaxID=2478898 RepID=A0AAW0FHC5_9APHY
MGEFSKNAEAKSHLMQHEEFSNGCWKECFRSCRLCDYYTIQQVNLDAHMGIHRRTELPIVDSLIPNLFFSVAGSSVTGDEGLGVQPQPTINPPLQHADHILEDMAPSGPFMSLGHSAISETFLGKSNHAHVPGSFNYLPISDLPDCHGLAFFKIPPAGFTAGFQPNDSEPHANPGHHDLYESQIPPESYGYLQHVSATEPTSVDGNKIVSSRSERTGRPNEGAGTIARSRSIHGHQAPRFPIATAVSAQLLQTSQGATSSESVHMYPQSQGTNPFTHRDIGNGYSN